MQATNPNLTKYVHWRKLIDHQAMKEIADNHGVFVIVMKPLSPPQVSDGNTYDFEAYILGEGSDYLGKFRHTTSCDWVQM